MGKTMNNAIRIGHEKDWDEFAKTHTEVSIWRNKNGAVVDVEPNRPDIIGFSIFKDSGVVKSVMYIFNDELVEFPPD